MGGTPSGWHSLTLRTEREIVFARADHKMRSKTLKRVALELRRTRPIRQHEAAPGQCVPYSRAVRAGIFDAIWQHTSNAQVGREST